MRLKDQHGQSLVEMAVIVPLILFIFLGLVEVGWALRGYLQLQTMSREAARVITKGTTTDLQAVQAGEPLDWAVQHVTRPQISPRDFQYTGDSPNAGFAIHYVGIDTGYPCQDQEPCARACDTYTPDDWFWQDDLIFQPVSDFYGMAFPSEFDPDVTIPELIHENNQINCGLQTKQGDQYTPSVNNVIIVEVYFEQPQLLGVPFISNTFTDPIVLRTSATMRFSEKTRP